MKRGTILVVALLLGGCWGDNDDTTGSVSACATRLYPQYNPKVLQQCVDVCIKCDRGVTTTCTASCTLKGAH
jgi:hypothetical protein